MTGLEQLDLMTRGGSIALLALWGWILIRDHRDQLAARLAIAMALAIICYLLQTGKTVPISTIGGLALSMCGASTAGIFWLFAKAWFNDETHIRVRDLVLVGIAALNTLVMFVSLPDGGIVNLIAGTLFRGGMLLFASAALWEAWRGREGDLIESRRRLRPRLVAAVGFYVVVIALAQIAVHNLGTPGGLLGIVNASIVAISLAFCAAMFGMRQADLFGPVVAARTGSARPAVDGPLADKLRNHMDEHKPHRDETLSIAKLAAQLGEQEYRLRRTINGQLGHRNFSAFLNGYRLAEVKAALADPTQRGVPIITIALDAGFGSLGPFNRAFREAEGMTPSEFRARALAVSEIG
ncbi:MAG: helix-turn-helix domain-containing protein [Erythrobacter sp.]